jgi:hypothetical protein
MKGLMKALEASGLEVTDLRGKLPTNPDVPFEIRNINLLNGGVAHHTAGWRKATAVGIAYWCIEKRDFPGMPYTFYIKWPDGAVDWCLDFEDIGWQTKKHNLESFGIALAGNYKDEEPPGPMIESLAILIAVLKDCFAQELWFQPHYALRPTVCPGKVWEAYLKEEQK